MVSPFRRHQQKARAVLAGSKAAPQTSAAPPAPAEDSPAGQEYAGLRAALHDNLRSLADIASHEQRQPKKAEFAKTFAPWIEGVIEANAPVQDEILVTNMIWAIDYGDLDYALRLGRFAIEHNLAMPEQYSRSVACFIAEEIAEIALKDEDAVRHDQLGDVLQLTAQADMPDQAKAKLFKALGRSWARRAEDFDATADNAPAGGAKAYAGEAEEMFHRALKLDEKSGVKTDIKQIEKLLKALGDAEDS
ncbi:phage terminase small subunit [Pelagerythrobacter sp.]|uniref:phage terminase small subunit n=1 Tax=Pelagerythrobacter sp. TaxID=2800702 RepID=UPI0035AF4662